MAPPPRADYDSDQEQIPLKHGRESPMPSYKVNRGGAQWGLVGEMIRKKQELEVRLAWDLLDTFNTTQELIGPLRAMAGKALWEMLWMPELPVDLAINSERGIRMQLLTNRVVMPKKEEGGSGVVKTVTRQDDLAEVLNDVNTLDAQYCSDIVRLYGTAVEKAAGDKDKPENDTVASGYYRKLLAKKDSHRKGGDETWNKDSSKNPFGRHRFHSAVQAGQYEAVIEQAEPGKVQQFLNSQGGGQAGFALADSSTIGKMDRVFGTVPASDISGTTADTIFFISRFSARNYINNLDSIFYLLPLATIVAGAHHSLLEVALPLSQSGKCDYRIGRYETLMPTERQGAHHAGIDNIQAALTAAQGHSYNASMLVCHDRPGSVAGCYVLEPGEVAASGEALSAMKAHELFRGVPAWPTQQQVETIGTQMGLRF